MHLPAFVVQSYAIAIVYIGVDTLQFRQMQPPPVLQQYARVIPEYGLPGLPVHLNPKSQFLDSFEWHAEMAFPENPCSELFFSQ
ncbi:hypothetical protein D3C81_2051020 [compost metagenome]